MHTAKRIAANSIFYTIALVIQKVLSSLYFWYYSNNLPNSAQDVGRFHFVLSFVTLFFILGDLGLYLVFLREASKCPASTNKYLNTLLVLKLPLIFLASLVILILGFIYQPESYLLITLALLWIIVDNLTHLFYAVLRSRQDLKYESLAAIVYQIIVIAIGVISIRLSGNILYLILALIIATGLNAIFALSLIIFKLGLKIKLSWDPQIARLFVKALPGFAAAGILVKILNSIDTVMLKQLSNDFQIVGFYSLPLKIITALSLTLPTALMGTVYPAFSHLWDKSTASLNKIFQKASEYLLIASLPMSFGFLALGKGIITGLWKPEYSVAVSAGQIMLFALPFIFLAYPTGNLLNASGRQRYTAISRGLGVVTLLFLDIILIPRLNLLGAAIALLCTHIVIWLSDCYFLRSTLKIILTPLLKQTVRVILACLLMLLTIKVLVLYLPWYVLILLGGAVYLIFLWLFRGLDVRFILKQLK